MASGKGGTGKTTVSTNLARVLSRSQTVQYLDCDVEEPNGHLFLHPSLTSSDEVKTPVPQVDEALCTHCAECSKICRFHAITSLGKITLTFPELCHGCGGCARICPVGAITEVGRAIGVLEAGKSGEVEFVQGRLNVGEAMSLPLIRAVLGRAQSDSVVILDAPPGTSCPVVTTLKGADKIVLVAEPTAFGLHDLTLAVDVVRELSLTCGVFINRSDIGDDRVERFCAERDIPIWGSLPHDRRIAEAYSRGVLAVDALSEASGHFERLANVLLAESSHELALSEEDRP